MEPSPIVIVGSGLAGYTLARELRKRTAGTPITIVSRDDGAVYSKPMLSNAIALGKSADALAQKTAAQFAADVGVSVLADSEVQAIDRSLRRIRLRTADGATRTLAYGALVLAVGADPRPSVIDGAAEPLIQTVNDLADYRRWRAGLTPGDTILLLGAGLVGCEFANDMGRAGYRVHVVDPAPWPLGRLLPDVLGAVLADALRRSGITLHLGRTLARVAGNDGILDDGTTVRFDRLLSAIGLIPRTSLAERAGLVIGRGIRVDRFLRTADPAIFAIGDCAETAAGPLPYVLPLMAEARALAATLSGQPTPLVLPALPVQVKTPCLPLVVCPPGSGAAGSWQVSGDRDDRRAIFQGRDGIPLGFALSGRRVDERQALAAMMPFLIADEAAA